MCDGGRSAAGRRPDKTAFWFGRCGFAGWVVAAGQGAGGWDQGGALGALGELTGVLPRLNRMFPTATLRQYFKG